MIKILKASAGSGKTHALAGTYIELLMDAESDYAYRNILAVTFTNKATEEMKSRILADLYKKACDASDPHHEKAARVLSNILHDYSAFAVSTIDKFFQQTLRAFAHELGHFSAYQVELDKQMLAEEAVDEILDSLDSSNKDDDAFINFVLENMQERLEAGKSLNIEDSLKSMALKLKSESFRLQCEQLGLNPEAAYSTEELTRLRKTCSAFKEGFKARVVKMSRELVTAALAAGFQKGDWNYKWFDGFYAASDDATNNPLGAFTDAKLQRAANPDGWFSKSKAGRLSEARAAIGDKLDDFLAYWDHNIKTVNTVDKIQRNIYGLGVACRLWTVFERIQKEKNVVCLDESNGMLKNIIAGSDAPFVYEKVGVRLNHFLLDEFQDTSVTQWENFKPLLAESNSHDERGAKVNNLIVGDVKQSIYRWRDSDWKLLDSEVKKAFPGAEEKNMDFNYRSDEAIVDFNNAFYPYAASCLDNYTGTDKISTMYKDCFQKVGKEEHKGRGRVYAAFYEDTEAQMTAIVEAVNKWHAQGVQYGDMAVLVRKNDKGTQVARCLIDNGIQVITEAALSIKSSVTVRRIVSMMALVDNPDNKISGNVARELNLTVPTAYHSLTGLCDDLYAMLASDPGYKPDCDAEAVYVTAFVDFLMDYTRAEGNNLHAFLEYWDSKDPCISSPLSADYVKITSIHKSKGLDFPYVIVPFVEDLELYHARTEVWCQPEIDDEELASVAASKLFRVELSSKDAGSGFKAVYEAERFDQAVDAINMMYVATTRASREMLLMGVSGGKKFSGSFASILNGFVREHPEKLSQMDQQEEKAAVTDPAATSSNALDITYRVYPIGERLTVRPYAADFFNEAERRVDTMAGRTRGIVLHDILSRVIRIEDIASAVQEAVNEGKLSADDAADVISRLQASAAQHPEYFACDEGDRVLSEQTVVNARGEQERPDRVVLRSDGSVLIVDYKFGENHPSYQRQLDRYTKLFLSMGYSCVRAELWFPFGH